MKKVIIIEDETIISFGYRLQLEGLGFDVVGSARSSEEAEALLEQTTPDIIIMDIYLKGEKNGLELAKEIHARSPIPILFLTASTKPEIISAIQDLKGCHYLSKPINSDSLEDVLMRFAQD
ncbi:MAG: response regulator [Flavobacteriales bacterium]|jgi:DNA-binding NarL/FixJ family response regulator|nr:response regulator [Flavobacteriales bacterium]MBK9514015.1 response regulator [Flavobacteriales bacterium]MBP7448439.1 response regulator [Flavobacteriales bacterium]HOZ41091.1 response regulator [Flavobacteriales bacterium]